MQLSKIVCLFVSDKQLSISLKNKKMTTTKQLIEATENFTGKNTVKNACTTGFMMVEMTTNELAEQVAKVWVEAKKMKVEISNNKVYAF